MSDLIDLEAGILDGVTKPTIDKIVKSGIVTIQQLSMQTPKALADNADIGEDTAEKAINKAMKFISEGFITARQLRDKHDRRTRLTTGVKDLDILLGGGIESETTTEISAEFSSGKTQICMTLAVLAQLPLDEGGLDGSVAWIDTEDTFRASRVYEIAENRGLNPESVIDHIYHASAYNSMHQKLLIEQLYEIVPKNNIKLVIVDSILGNLRSEYLGRGTLGARQDMLKDMLHTLMKVSLSTRTTVVYTNQVLDNPGIMYGNPQKPTGGNVMAHAATTRIQLRRATDPKRIAKLIDSSYLPPGEAPFIINERGIDNLV